MIHGKRVGLSRLGLTMRNEALERSMDSFSLNSTKAELASWAGLTAKELSDAPERLELTSGTTYPVIGYSRITSARSVTMMHLETSILRIGSTLVREPVEEQFTVEQSVLAAISETEAWHPCLVPVRSFLAFRHSSAGVAEPYSFARLSDEIVGLAGLVRDNSAKAAGNRTCIVLQVDAPGLLSPFFRCLPAIVEASDYTPWLEWDGISATHYAKVIRALSAISLKDWYTVPAEKARAARDRLSRTSQ